MKRTLLSLLIGISFLVACTKEKGIAPLLKPEEACFAQTDNPEGRSYIPDSFRLINYSQKNCGFLPLSCNSYWVYKDSVFSDGSFLKVQHDTLRFSKTYQSLPDKLTWWATNIKIGLPDMVYANDSAIFLAEYRVFSPDPVRDVKKTYSIFPGDSIYYLTSIDDNAAIGRSVKLQETIKTPAGNFDNCLLFEKTAPFYRKDQVIFKPGVGVIKYISEVAPAGSPVMKLQQISTLVSYHID